MSPACPYFVQPDGMLLTKDWPPLHSLTRIQVNKSMPESQRTQSELYQEWNTPACAPRGTTQPHQSLQFCSISRMDSRSSLSYVVPAQHKDRISLCSRSVTLILGAKTIIFFAHCLILRAHRGRRPQFLLTVLSAAASIHDQSRPQEAPPKIQAGKNFERSDDSGGVDTNVRDT